MTRRRIPRLVAACALAGLAGAVGGCTSDTPIVRDVPLVRDVFPAPPFPEGWRVVDLTLPLDVNAPHIEHPRQFPFERLDFAPAGRGLARTGAFTAMEHMGTYLAAPRTRDDAGATAERFGGSDLLLPLVIVDVPSDASSEAAITDAAVREDERTHGPVPPGAAVVLETRARPGDAAHPGWTGAAVRWLVKERGARVVGTDAAAVDPTSAAKSPAQAAAAALDAWTVAGLKGLADLPPRGAFLVIGSLPIVGGTGAPARVVALVPPADAVRPPERGR
jgi:kynurenine formamidase